MVPIAKALHRNSFSFKSYVRMELYGLCLLCLTAQFLLSKEHDKHRRQKSKVIVIGITSILATVITTSQINSPFLQTFLTMVRTVSANFSVNLLLLPSLSV